MCIPLMNVIDVVPCWDGSIHMLCLFHTLTISFHETIFKLLPHQESKEKKHSLPLDVAMVNMLYYFLSPHYFVKAIVSSNCNSTNFMLYPSYSIITIQGAYSFNINFHLSTFQRSIHLTLKLSQSLNSFPPDFNPP